MPGHGTLAVVHDDAACIVVVKPAGLLSVPGRGEQGQDCLSAQVQAAFSDALVVHRLDMATSGLMLFARGAAAQRVLSIAFAAREVHKRYVAIVDGLVEHDTGEIELPLMADWPNRPKQKADRELQAFADTLPRARARRECTHDTRRAGARDRPRAPAARAPAQPRPPDPR